MLILQQLFLGEVIVNEHRQKEYISRRIILSREDTRSIEIYQAAENAIKRMDESTFAWKEDARFTAEFQADLFHIVQWMILAREMIVPVEKNKKGICAQKEKIYLLKETLNNTPFVRQYDKQVGCFIMPKGFPVFNLHFLASMLIKFLENV